MHPFARSIALGLLLAASAAQAAPWTYRGTLNDGGVPAHGRYDFRLSLLDAGGAKSLAYPLTFGGVEVKNGAFSIEVDFGLDLTQFGALKLRTEVAQGGSGFVALGEPKPFDAKAALGSMCWDTAGNAGTNDATDFLGTTDGEHLILKAGNSQVMRYAAPNNVIGGSSANNVDTFGGSSQTIAGGGSAAMTCGSADNESCANQVVADFGSIGGGAGNYVFGEYATIAGGDSNDVTGNAATIAGGRTNTASAMSATIGGGASNYATLYSATVGGGVGNSASGYSLGFATIAGGSGNLARGDFSMVPGGYANQAGGDYSFAAGRSARVRTAADAGESTATCVNNCGDEGAFVWADALIQPFTSTGPNQFLMRANGGVGINTAHLGNHPNLRSAELTVRSINGDPNVDMNLMTANARGYSMAVVPDGAAGAGTFYLQEINAVGTGEPAWSPRLIITPSGQTQVQGGAVGTISDARLKKNIGDIERPLDTLLALRGHRFEYLDPAQALGAAGTRIGFVAQEVREVLPQWVSENGAGYYSVAPSGFEALAVEAIREQQSLIAALQARNGQLQQAVQALAERLAALEAAKEH
jgi:hypothetical protein